MFDRASLGMTGRLVAFAFPEVVEMTADSSTMALFFLRLMMCHLFLTELSERPGKSFAIFAHWLPMVRWDSLRRSSSS